MLEKKWNRIRDVLECTVFTTPNMVILTLLFSLTVFVWTECSVTAEKEFCVTFKKSGQVEVTLLSEKMKTKAIGEKLEVICMNFRYCFPAGGYVTVSSTTRKVEVVADGWPPARKYQILDFCKIIGSYSTDGSQLFLQNDYVCADIDTAQPDLQEMIWTGMLE